MTEIKPQKSIHSLFFWYFSKKVIPYWCIFILDCCFVFFTMLFVYTANNGVTHTAQTFWPVCGTLGIYLIFYIIGFRLFRTYQGVIRYSSFVDLQRVCWAMLVGLCLSVVFKYAVGNHTVFVPIRLRDLVLSTLVSMLIMWAVRVLVKHLYDTLYNRVGANKVFIFGVREGGISIAKSIRNQDPAKYIVAGFASTRHEMDGKMLMGVKIHSFDEALIDHMKAQNAKALFVSPLRSETLRENQEMVQLLIDNGIRIFMVPTEQEWDGKSDLNYQTMREVDIEDLLPREQIEVDLKAIGELLRDKRILITGAAGSIGSEIVRQIASFKPEKLILIDQAETPLHDIRLMMAKEYAYIPAETIVSDIAQKDRMENIFEEHKPQYVFHAAAYKHVPMMENNPAEAIHNNVEGTKVIADLSVKYGVDKFVMVSTDKAVNPTNVMGASKRICEIYVQSLDKAEKEGKIEGKTQFVTTRFGNVLGSNGSVIPLFKEQIRKGGPITVTHPDIIRYFMLIPVACKLVLEAGTMGNGGEIFVFDMGKPVRIADLAQRMITLSGAKVDIVFTGLRDGEKLYEEVLNEEETTLPTFHPKIKIARVREYDYAEVNETINKMVRGCYAESHMTVVKHMKALVPEFKSKHSIYEALDKVKSEE